MMKTNLTKKAAALLTFLAVMVTSVVIAPVDTFAKETNPIDEYLITLYAITGESSSYVADNGAPCIIDSDFWGSVTWYKSFGEALEHCRFDDCGSRAEYKKYWLFGWRTQNCAITGRWVVEYDGEFAPIYINDYDNKWHTDNRYM